jgi:hypothetical protein
VWLGVLVVLSVGISMGQDTTSTLKSPISPAMRPALPERLRRPNRCFGSRSPGGGDRTGFG